MIYPFIDWIYILKFKIVPNLLFVRIKRAVAQIVDLNIIICFRFIFIEFQL